MKLSATLVEVALFLSSLPSHAAARNGRTPNRNTKRQAVGNPQWAGVVAQQPSGLNFTGVAAVITMPTVVQAPPGAPAGNYYGSAWVGLDGGNSGDNALVQAGVTWNLVDGALSWTMWYEWIPNAETGIVDSSITIQPGDQFAITLNVDSPTEVTVEISDITQNEAAQIIGITAPEGVTVGGVTAEWIVEDLYYSQQLGFADFGSVTFDSCSATLSDGSYLYPPSGQQWDVVDANGNVLTGVEVGDNTVEVIYDTGAGSQG